MVHIEFLEQEEGGTTAGINKVKANLPSFQPGAAREKGN